MASFKLLLCFLALFNLLCTTRAANILRSENGLQGLTEAPSSVAPTGSINGPLAAGHALDKRNDTANVMEDAKPDSDSFPGLPIDPSKSGPEEYESWVQNMETTQDRSEQVKTLNVIIEITRYRQELTQAMLETSCKTDLPLGAKQLEDELAQLSAFEDDIDEIDDTVDESIEAGIQGGSDWPHQPSRTATTARFFEHIRTKAGEPLANTLADISMPNCAELGLSADAAAAAGPQSGQVATVWGPVLEKWSQVPDLEQSVFLAEFVLNRTATLQADSEAELNQLAKRKSKSDKSKKYLQELMSRPNKYAHRRKTCEHIKKAMKVFCWSVIPQKYTQSPSDYRYNWLSWPISGGECWVLHFVALGKHCKEVMQGPWPWDDQQQWTISQSTPAARGIRVLTTRFCEGFCSSIESD